MKRKTSYKIKTYFYVALGGIGGLALAISFFIFYVWIGGLE